MDDTLIKVEDLCKIYNPGENEVRALDGIDLEIGKGETMKYILALKDQPEAAQLALRVGIAVAKSDGNFDADEQNAVREIARALGFDPAEFGL